MRHVTVRRYSKGVTKLLRLRCVTALNSLFEGRGDYCVHARVVSQVCRVALFGETPFIFCHEKCGLLLL